jgi:hypothetical protein
MAKAEPGVVVIDEKSNGETLVARYVVEAARAMLDDAARRAERFVVADSDHGDRRSRPEAVRVARALRRSEDTRTRPRRGRRGISRARLGVILAAMAGIACVTLLVRRRSQASRESEPGAAPVEQHTATAETPSGSLIGEPTERKVDLQVPG